MIKIKEAIIRILTHNKLIFLTLDTISITIAWFLSYYIRQNLTNLLGYPLNPFINYIKILPILIPTWLIENSAYGLYNKIKKENYIFIMQAVLKTTFLGSLITMSIAYWLREFSIGRSTIFIFIILVFLFLLITRTSYLALHSALIKKGYALTNILIVGAGETGIRSLQKISEHPEFGYKVVGFLDDDIKKHNTFICNIPVIGSLDKLKQIANDMRISKIIFAIPSLSKDTILKKITEINKRNITYMIVSNIFPVMSENMFFEDIGGTPYFILKSNGEANLYDYFKRIFDLIGAIILLIIFTPIIPFIALGIKLDSKGSIIFKQQRVGLNGKLFTIYKFRTMFSNVECYERAPDDKNDPRVTRFGKFLRKFSLDEIPQFINVIKGDMSLIGPRPEMPFITDKYNDWQRKRLEVRPGITGLWQVLGRKELPLENNLEYDFYYIANRSFSLDFAILIKTIFMVIRQKGAF